MRRKKTYRGLRSRFSCDRHQLDTGRNCANESYVSTNQQPFTRRPLMLSPSHRLRIASIVALVLLMPLLYPLLAEARVKTSTNTTQGQQEKKTKDNDKDKDKAESTPKDDKNNLSKQERQWLTVFRFSKQRYETNPEFRGEVDEAFRRMQREHSEYAFAI